MSAEKRKNSPINRFIDLAHRFESWISIGLYSILTIVVIIAMIRLVLGVYDVVFVNWDVKNIYSIQLLFGMVMTVLIALEFGNSILRHIKDRTAVIQVKEIILLGLMAVVRKIMLVDLSSVSPLLLAALGFAAVSLAGTYWVISRNGVQDTPEI